jgi:hypothetical protein
VSPLAWVLLLVIVVVAGLFLVQMDELRTRLRAELTAHGKTVDRLAEAQRAFGESESALSQEQEMRGRAEAAAEQLRAELAEARAIVVAPRTRTPTEQERKVLLENKCAHCGGAHAIACPRVKRMRFRPDGQSIYEIEFWDTWDKSRVVFPEELFEESNAQGEGLPASPTAA